MGQKTDRIRELESELAAERYLLRHIGDTLGVEFEPPTTTAEAQREHQRFLGGLRSMKGGGLGLVDWDKAKAAPVDAIREFDHNHLTPPRRPRPAAPGSWDTHDELVDEQIERLEAQGLTKPREGSDVVQTAMMVSSAAPGDDTAQDLLGSIARELGLNVEQMPLHEALGAIYEEILQAKNLGADVEAEAGSKFLSAGKSLGQAIAHDHAQAADLRDGVTQARTIVARLAAVMQIDKWDKDGTELLERVQRWEGWKHELKRRVRELRSTPPYATVTLAPNKPVGWVDVHKQIADELDRHLQRLLSTKEMADWLKANEKAGATTVDAGPPVPPYPFEFRQTDIHHIRMAVIHAGAADGVDTALAGRLSGIGSVLHDLAASMVGAQEFARTMNLIILPILARQRAAQKVPADADGDAT